MLIRLHCWGIKAIRKKRFSAHRSILPVLVHFSETLKPAKSFDRRLRAAEWIGKFLKYRAA